MKFVNSGSFSDIIHSTLALFEDLLNDALLFEVIDLIFDLSALFVNQWLTV